MNGYPSLLASWHIGKQPGSTVTASLTGDGLFLVTGTGDARIYASSDFLPWKDHAHLIRQVWFSPEVQITSIVNWFYNCINLTQVRNLPASLMDMDEAFIDCINLSSIPEIPHQVVYACDTFVNCHSLSGTTTLRGPLTQYAYMFQNAATAQDAHLVINYTRETASIIDGVLSTAGPSSNISKGYIVKTI